MSLSLTRIIYSCITTYDDDDNANDKYEWVGCVFFYHTRFVCNNRKKTTIINCGMYDVIQNICNATWFISIKKSTEKKYEKLFRRYLIIPRSMYDFKKELLT